MYVYLCAPSPKLHGTELQLDLSSISISCMDLKVGSP